MGQDLSCCAEHSSAAGWFGGWNGSSRLCSFPGLAIARGALRVSTSPRVEHRGCGCKRTDRPPHQSMVLLESCCGGAAAAPGAGRCRAKSKKGPIHPASSRSRPPVDAWWSARSRAHPALGCGTAISRLDGTPWMERRFFTTFANESQAGPVSFPTCGAKMQGTCSGDPRGRTRGQWRCAPRHTIGSMSSASPASTNFFDFRPTTSASGLNPP